MLTILSMIQVQSIFLNLPNKRKACARAKLLFSCVEGDLITYLNVYLAFEESGHSPKWCVAMLVKYEDGPIVYFQVPRTLPQL